MSTYNPHFQHTERGLDAANRWKDRCFLHDGSVFSEQKLWTIENTREVKSRFNDNPDATNDSFLVKLRRQFEEAKPDTTRLMSEMLWILNLFPCNIGANAKRKIVREIWSWSGSELEIAHPMLSDQVLEGFGSGGPGYLAHRWRELRFLVNLTLDFKARDVDGRSKLLNSPWAFVEWVNEVPDEGYRQLKLILPFLVFPANFERISSPRDIRRIVSHFTPQIDVRGMSNLESARALLSIRERLESERGSSIDFYEDDIKRRWAGELDTEPTQLPSLTGTDAHGAAKYELNTIFYGPPGTGKTYRTVERALGILDPLFLRAHGGDRDALKSRFDELIIEGRITFVTFHQSFSYEDFVEGIRAETTSSGSLRYYVEDGVFKKFCTAPFELPYGSDYSVLATTPEVLWLQKPNGSQLPLPWKMLDELCALVRENRITVDDIKAKRVFERVPNSRLEKFIVNGYNNIIPHVVTALLTSRARKAGDATAGRKVMIIDEINRGNISKIFGELITLLEPSKRADAPEALSAVLPYSKTRFSVPSDVYIIGTMNTADRSISTLDLALRRRFSFEEIEPDSSLLQDVEVAGVNIGVLLDRLNARIEALLDRDHRLGHASFLSIAASDLIDQLGDVFRSQIIPLLQEYFFDDWNKIRLVLNDHNKSQFADCFIVKKNGDTSPFGEGANDLRVPDQWELNRSAFERPSAYAATIGEN